MEDYALVIQLALFVIPMLVCGVLIGRNVEKSHIKRLDADDVRHNGFLITQLKSFPMRSPAGPPPTMVVAEAVIASDYLKSWLVGGIFSVAKCVRFRLFRVERNAKRWNVSAEPRCPKATMPSATFALMRQTSEAGRPPARLPWPL